MYNIMGIAYCFGELTTTNDSIKINPIKVIPFRKSIKLSGVKKPTFIGALLVIIVLLRANLNQVML